MTHSPKLVRYSDSGRFLGTRGAVFPALASLGLSEAAMRRSEAALCYGCWQMPDLLTRWRQVVAHEGRFVPDDYEGVRPVDCDLTAFFRPLSSVRFLPSAFFRPLSSVHSLPSTVFRPQLLGQDGKLLDSRHYVSDSGKALPTIVLGLCAGVWRVAGTRRGLPASCAGGLNFLPSTLNYYSL